MKKGTDPEYVFEPCVIFPGLCHDEVEFIKTNFPVGAPESSVIFSGICVDVPEFIYMYANFTVGVIEPALHFQHFAFAMLTLYRLHS